MQLGFGLGFTATQGAVDITPSAPVITGLPTISGTEAEGETLSAGASGVSGYPSPTRTWQWERSGTPISGATSSTYVLQAADVGATLTVVQTETNSEGSDTAESAATGTIAAAPDTTAPVLSSPTGAANGSTGATSLGVTTDEGNGTLYWGIYPTASTPSAADVVAGTGATVSGSQAVSGTGVQSVANQSGLTASTAYKAHYVHDDAASNRSNLATSAEFTTGAAATAPAQFGAGDWSVASGDTQATVTIAALPSDGGAAITAIEYQLDGGSWVDSGRTTTGAFTISGLTNLIEYQVALRAVNAVGNGTASATKAVTPAEGTLALNYDPDGTPVFGLVDGSDVTVTIDGTPYVIALADLSDDFHMLGTSTVTGTDGVGNTWTAVEGLHVFSDGEEPVITYQWKDGDDADITGATNATYVQQAGDDTAGLKVVITFSNGSPLTVVHTDTVEAIAKPVPAGAVVSGYTGTMIETEDASYYYKTLTTDGTISFSAGGVVDIEGIGGGGGGGQDRGGGGGAGARIVQTGVTVGAQGYAVVIGAGGVGGVDGVSAPTSGAASTFDAGGSINLAAAGGGHGGASDGGFGPVPANGGCGGGCGRTQATPGTGSVGGDGGNTAENDAGGGGGGMGGNGGAASAGPTAGVGGAGVTGFLGDTVCEGGAGGLLTTAFDPTTPTNVGSGGGGGNRNGVAGTRHGANGSNGRVVIRIAK